MLSEKLKEDLKHSLKSGNSERVGIVRLFISEVNNKQKEKFYSNEDFFGIAKDLQ